MASCHGISKPKETIWFVRFAGRLTGKMWGAMPDIIIEVTGIRELQAQLDKLSDVGAVVGPALLISGYELRDWVKKYPSATAANSPKQPGRWYERGRGSMYARRDGTVRVVKASEMLNRRWAIAHTFAPEAAEVRIGNDASYVRYVHDEEKQARFHTERGWRTAQAAIKKFEAGIVRRIAEAIDKVIK